MTNKLSEKAGGGLVFTPAMMDYGNGGAYHINSANTGNKVTAVAKFKTDAFVTATQSIATIIINDSNKNRAKIELYASDHATTEYRSKIKIIVVNSTGTTICHLLSELTYDDNDPHTLFFSFDGDSGAATFIIDGVDADDTGFSSRVAPTTGTLQTASQYTYVGKATLGGGTNEWPGELGFIGLSATYLTNWQDFMTSEGYIKEIDESGWAEWGAQPIIWNSHGDVSNNLGSWADLTLSGTRPEISNVGSTGHPILGINTVGDVVAADIATGKIAWVNGVEIIGTG